MPKLKQKNTLRACDGSGYVSQYKFKGDSCRCWFTKDPNIALDIRLTDADYIISRCSTKLQRRQILVDAKKG